MPIVPSPRVMLTGLVTIVALSGAIDPGSARQPAPTCALDPLMLPLFGATPAAIVAAASPVVGPLAPVEDREIRVAVKVIVACLNTGDAAYRYAVFTDRYLATALADPSATSQPLFEQRIAEGPTATGPGFTLVAVDAVDPLNDGRVSVVVELSAGGATYRDTLVLARVEGVWLIDAVESLDPPR